MWFEQLHYKTLCTPFTSFIAFNTVQLWSDPLRQMVISGVNRGKETTTIFLSLTRIVHWTSRNIKTKKVIQSQSWSFSSVWEIMPIVKETREMPIIILKKSQSYVFPNRLCMKQQLHTHKSVYICGPGPQNQS